MNNLIAESRALCGPSEAGGRPPTFDKASNKRRTVIERYFQVFKQWGGIATRYDKLALTYRGGDTHRGRLISRYFVGRHALVH